MQMICTSATTRKLQQIESSHPWTLCNLLNGSLLGKILSPTLNSKPGFTLVCVPPGPRIRVWQLKYYRRTLKIGGLLGSLMFAGFCLEAF